MFGWFKKKKEETKVVTLRPTTPVKKEAPVKKPVKTQKVRYLCNSCGYRFSRTAGIEFNSCPYCGKKSVEVDQTASADKILEMSKTYDDDRFFPSR